MRRRILLFTLAIIAGLICIAGCEKKGKNNTRGKQHKVDVSPLAKEEQRGDMPPTITGKDGAPMVLIPAGEFQMGSNDYDSEKPVHTVYINAFYIDKYEVAVGQYKQFLKDTGHSAPNWSLVSKYSPTDNYPIIYVSWDDTQAYCKWAGKRLPTEAEWEKAARGGLVGKKYPWGDEEPDGTQCNFADKNTDFDWSDKNVDDGYKYTAPVGSYLPNGYGLHDMAGNVYEWCADWHGSDYYSSSSRENPHGPSTGTFRVVRGGSWYFDTYYMRAAARSYITLPTSTYDYYGFRCVLQDLIP